MSYVKRILQLPTSRNQHLLELAIIAVLAFTLGTAANSIGRGTARTAANDQPLVVASEAHNQAAVAAPRASAPVRVPYEAGWQLYDGGWAGGPRTAPHNRIDK